MNTLTKTDAYSQPVAGVRKNRSRPLRAVSQLALLAASLIALGACSRETGNPQPHPIAKKVTTRIKWLPGATYIGSFAARDTGAWERRGLTVEILPGGFEADPIKLVAAGSNDFGITGSEQLLQARAQGVPIVAIFMELQTSPVGWMTLAASGIKTPTDFLGHRVGAQYGTNTEPTLDALLSKLNLDSTKITRVPVKYDVAPLFTGQVDVLPIYLNGQPVQARREGHEVNTIDPADYGLLLYGNVYFTTEKTIHEQSELVQKFVSGLLEGWQLAVDNPQAAVDHLVQGEPTLEPGLELAILHATLPFVKGPEPTPLGMMTAARWQQTRDTMVKYAELPPEVTVEGAFTNQFVEAAHKAR